MALGNTMSNGSDAGEGGGGAAVAGGMGALAAAGPYGMAAMAIFSVISSNQQAASIRAQAKIQERINEDNAQLAEQDAFNAEAQGYTDEARYQSVIDQTLGKQKVIYAAQGVDASYGSAADVQSETKMTGFLNTLDIQNQARKKALGYTQQAENIRLGSFMGSLAASDKANAVETQGYVAAAGYALKGLGGGSGTAAAKASGGYGTTNSTIGSE